MDIVEARMNIVGFSLLNNINGGSYSFSVIKLKDWRNVLRMVNL
jgi:HAE1 family hydrophobic/amphiphilic exporter-1